MNVENDPIPRRRLFEEVERRLLERIRNGDIAPGEQMPSERELMLAFGVGRPAVREALQNLARSGIVEIVQGERARVRLPTAESLIAQIGSGTRHLLRVQPDTLEHLKDARLFLETGMARRAAERATDADLTRLRERFDEHRQALNQLELFLERDMAFHREIARIGGNPIFPALVEATFRWASEYYSSIVRAPGAENVTLAEHQRLLDAICAHDPDQAEQAMRDHLTRASDQYRL